MSGDEANGELLKNYRSDDDINKEKAKNKSSLSTRLVELFIKFKIRAVLGHLGLLVALCVYCFFGGIVSIPNLNVFNYNLRREDYLFVYLLRNCGKVIVKLVPVPFFVHVKKNKRKLIKKCSKETT